MIQPILLDKREYLLPAFDDLALARGELQGLAALVALIELFAIRQGAFIMDVDSVPAPSKSVNDPLSP